MGGKKKESEGMGSSEKARGKLADDAGRTPADMVRNIFAEPGNYLTRLTAVCFIFLLCYNFGFFCVGLGIDMGTSHFLMADYFETVSLVAFYMLYIVFIVLSTHILFGIFDSEDVGKKSKPSDRAICTILKNILRRIKDFLSVLILGFFFICMLLLVVASNNLVMSKVYILSIPTFIFGISVIMVAFLSSKKRLVASLFTCGLVFYTVLGFSDARGNSHSDVSVYRIEYVDTRYDAENVHVLRILSEDILIVRDCPKVDPRNVLLLLGKFDCRPEFIKKDLIVRMTLAAGDEKGVSQPSDSGE